VTATRRILVTGGSAGIGFAIPRRLARQVGREWGPLGIRVNALAPGFVPTDGAQAKILSDPAAEARMLEMIPLGRFARVDEISAAAAWLLSEQASYCTGAVLTADGGRSLGVGMHGVRTTEEARP
jgi:NAD(P)-dependent dehydrogenase (short-subunit alcohol dehydrogenase family)